MKTFQSTSRTTRFVVWTCLILGGVKTLGAFFHSFGGAGIYGSPFGGMSIEEATGTKLLILTGPVCMFAAGVVAFMQSLRVAARMLLAGAILSLLACWYLSWALLLESGYWWEYALGFEVVYFVILGLAFPLPMYLLGRALYREHVTHPIIHRQYRKWVWLGIGVSVMLYGSIRFPKPLQQQLAIRQIERWGGSVHISRERVFPEHLPNDYHKPEIHESVHVRLEETVFDDSYLSVVTSLGNVTRLDLSNTQTGDAAMVHLAHLTGLESLNLSGTHVTDEGLTLLTKLQQLQTINLYGTPTTKKGRDQLRVALPYCRI